MFAVFTHPLLDLADRPPLNQFQSLSSTLPHPKPGTQASQWAMSNTTEVHRRPYALGGIG